MNAIFSTKQNVNFTDRISGFNRPNNKVMLMAQPAYAWGIGAYGNRGMVDYLSKRTNMDNYLDQILCFTAYCEPNSDIYEVLKNLSDSGALGGWTFSTFHVGDDYRPRFIRDNVSIVVNKSSLASNIAHSSNVFPFDDVHDHVSANSYLNDLASHLSCTGILNCSVHKPQFA